MKEAGKLCTAEWLSGVFLLVYCFSIALAYPLCTNMEAPHRTSGNNTFCSSVAYKRNGCCSSIDDQAIRQTYDSMNISDTRCAAVVQQILCSKCDAYSGTLWGQLFREGQRTVPYLCNSTSSRTKNNVTGHGYCHDVWNSCYNVTIQNSLFSPVLAPGAPPPSSSSVKSLVAYQNGSIGSVFASEAEFCTAFAPSNVAPDYCFGGGSFVPPKPPSNSATLLPQDICVEKVAEGTFLNMVPHPDGSSRVAITDQAGLIWLADAAGPGKPMVYNVSKPFLDLSSRVTNQIELGLLGFAFHPDFADNGRFFVSYNCDKEKWADCGGTCGCNDDTNCNPSHLRNGEIGGDNTDDPCRYSSVIAEYNVNSTANSGASPLLAEVANPVEVRRTFLMSLPYIAHHGGQLLFGPLDNYLYFMMGDGGGHGDPFNFAQNPKSLLGKILRLDVDNLPNASDISNQELWGVYSIPPTNPFYGQNETRPEIWASGFRNPWRCSFDSKHPMYFYCGDVGQDEVEEVDLISKGGNYGWRIYEGNATFSPTLSPGGNTSAKSINAIFPVLEYGHPPGTPSMISAAVTGGMVSYSREDACLYGRYLYADLFTQMYVGAEVPQFSGNYISQSVNYKCSAVSPLNCTYSSVNSSTPSLVEILSFGSDNAENLYILGGSGVYRVVNPSNCNIACNDALPPLPPSSFPNPAGLSPSPTPAPGSSHSSAHFLRNPGFSRLPLAILSSMVIAISFFW